MLLFLVFEVIMVIIDHEKHFRKLSLKILILQIIH